MDALSIVTAVTSLLSLRSAALMVTGIDVLMSGYAVANASILTPLTTWPGASSLLVSAADAENVTLLPSPVFWSVP